MPPVQDSASERVSPRSVSFLTSWISGVMTIIKAYFGGLVHLEKLIIIDVNYCREIVYK
jgi:hypothetical protein